ncbi:hypothetical protein GPJ61_27570 [Brevibacillus formosus]|uniref:DUF5983 family protein n=1 Tax=Brevibacillus formosus TaxID=54913 RepID=UPI001CA4F7D5|nr:hypothetical protein [Brevibacillus formosus]MBW5471550.1 hypothetical protein [Brevibacillus formosus]
MNLTVFTMLELSTAHISLETNQMLEDNTLSIAFVAKSYRGIQYGWFIAVPYDDEDDLMWLPDDLEKIVNLAKERNLDWVMLDCEGARSEHLPVFEW